LPAVLFLPVPCAGRSVSQGFHTLVLVVARWWLEIPLVMRILRRNVASKTWSQVLTFDYLAQRWSYRWSLPLVLVPQLGPIRTGLLFGVMNAASRKVAVSP
jgi:spermidine synthase